MLNYANKGIVDVSNANKGKIFVPKKLVIHKLDGALAYTIKEIESEAFGTLGINPDYFTHESLNKMINNTFVNPKTKLPTLDNSKDKIKEGEKVKIVKGLSKDIFELIDKFKEDPAKLTLNDKIRIDQSLTSAYEVYIANVLLKKRLPLEWLRNNLKLFKDNNIEVDLNKLKGLSKDAQAEEVNKLLKTWAEKTGNKYLSYGCIDNPHLTLYHEMGHLQDYALNLEKLQKNELGRLNFFTVMKNAFNGKKTLNSVADHWGGKTYETQQELMKKDPELFKEVYPNLYKHINDTEIQRVASQVSYYATTGIGEFIAETYASMIAGEKLSDDVLALYKKYNGPLPNAFK